VSWRLNERAVRVQTRKDISIVCMICRSFIFCLSTCFIFFICVATAIVIAEHALARIDKRKARLALEFASGVCGEERVV